MKTPLIEGLAVLVLLIAGWLVGTCLVAKQAKGMRERRFTIRAGIVVLVGILALTALDGFVVKISGGFFGIILFFAFLILRRRQLQIRREEQIG
jgi:hypothetical protein